jgi:hypothetical protein
LALQKTISNFCDNHLRFVATKTLSPIQFSKKVAIPAAISREIPSSRLKLTSTQPFMSLATLSIVEIDHWVVAARRKADTPYPFLVPRKQPLLKGFSYEWLQF